MSEFSMVWVLVAVIGYFLSAGAKIIDKFLLAESLPEPLVFTFFVGLLSIGVVIFMPFGFVLIAPSLIFLACLTGACTLCGLYFFYKALRTYDASRVVPLVATFGPFFTLLASFVFLGGEALGENQLYAFCFLVLGGVLLTVDTRVKGLFIPQLLLWSLAAAIFVALSFVGSKLIFNQTTFINGVIWTRFGIFAAAIALLVLPRLRILLATMPRVGSSRKVLFLGDKVIGALSLLCINYAIKHGSPALVNALASFEYLFVFLFVFVIAFTGSKKFIEDMSPKALMLKIGGSFSLGLSLIFLFMI